MVLFFYCITFIKNYDKIKFLSILGLCAIFLLFCFILYNLLNDLYHHDLPKNKYKPFNYKGIPESISLTLFSFGGHVVFPEIFSSIKNTKKLQKNIIYTWTTVTIFVNSFIFTGFILYGDYIHDNIINNLNQSYLFKKIITALLLLNIIFTFPLMFTPLNLRIILNIQNLKINESFKKFLYKYFIRLCLIISICIIGSYWKSYLNIMSVIGGLLENTTSIILPSIFSLKFLKLNLFEKVINVLIIEFGFILMCFTIYNCFY
jgi:vesicular inhibitory amino acid transporter